MNDKEINKNTLVKKQTLLISVGIAFFAGFLVGVLLGIYKSGTGEPIQKSIMPQQPTKGQNLSVEKSVQIFELEKVTSENPKNVDAWIKLANLYFDTDNYEKAIAVYTKSLELKPDNAHVLTDLGIMYRRTGKPLKAIKAFDRAIRIDPDHQEARFNKGIVLMHDLNDVNGAILAWEELVKLNPAAMSPTGQPISNLVKKLKGSMKQ